MKINNLKLPFTKKSILLTFFFMCMFVFASFTKEDRQKIREIKKEIISKLIHENKTKSFNDIVSNDENLSKKEKITSPKGFLKPNYSNPFPINLEKKSEPFLKNKDESFVGDNFYSSKEKEGTIGTFTEKEQDRISDNFFTIEVPTIDKTKKAYLEYELFGLASHQSVSRSINHNIAFGGEIIIPSAKWSHQREEISTTLIKEGVNTVLFTSPTEGVKYKIKNLKIVFGKDKKSDQNLIISSTLSGNKLYVKGNYALTNILNINNENVSTKNGEFEKIFELSDNDRIKGSFSIVTGSNTTTYKIPEESVSFKVSNNNYVSSKNLEIVQSKELDVNYEDLNIKIEKETSESAFIEISKLRAKDFPSTTQGIKNITLNNSAYRFTVLSGKLNKKVKLTIPYDEKRLGLVSPKDIKVFYFDYTKKQWLIESSAVVDEKSKTVTFESNGDNDYINGIISVPESPQTNAFAPTSISGLKAADPVSKVQLLSPPTSNQRGDAAMSYPIQIPAGRNGMQPNLSIVYNSSKGNGWMGEGWDVAGISSITLDTRWGTPAFDPGSESEIYMLDGEMLMYEGDYLPHRHNAYNANGTFDTTRQARNTSGKKTFYLRKNNNFLKIERYGDYPTNYRWIITATDGTKKYYGGDETSVNNNAVVKTGQGNIVQWGITKEIDVYGNNIKYYYENTIIGQGLSIPNNPNNLYNENLVDGRDFHIKEIKYTGQNDSDGPYNIFFWCKDIDRPDYSISAKEGMKRVEVRELEYIAVAHYINAAAYPVKKYTFDYETGAFHKTLLKSIVTDDVEYKLEYYNDIGGGTLFGPDQTISVPNTDAFSGAVSAVTTPSKISADNNFEWGWSLRVGVGLGLFRKHKTGDKNFMINGFGGQSYPKNKRAQELIDFNGDGALDILYRKRNGDNGIKLIPGSFDNNGNLTFGSQLDVLNLKSNFTKTEGTTWTTGATVLFNWWKMGFDFTKSWSQSESNTPVFLIDANSDGLPDVVNNGKVWFNKINTNGQPEMVTTSDMTENMVITGNTPVPYAEPEDPADEEPVKAKNDVVKVWIAPKAGYVKIYDQISIAGTQDPAAKAVYSIEIQNPWNQPKNGRLYLITLTGGGPVQTIDIQHYNDYPGTPLGINNSSRIHVNSGDKIYFRLHKRTGVNYIVNTTPAVYYVDANGTEIQDSLEEEQDDYMPNQTDYGNKFILNNLTKTLKFDKLGSGHIEIPGFTVPKLNDNVRFTISLSKGDIVDPATDVIILHSETYPESGVPVTIAPVSLNFSVPSVIPEGWHLKFLVESDSYMNKEIEWKEILVTFGSINTHEVAEYPSYYTREFKKKFDLSLLSGLPQGTNNYSISLNKNFSFSPNLPGEFMYVIKQSGRVLGKRKVVIHNGTLSEYDMGGVLINGIDPILFYSGDPAQGLATEQKINILVYCNTSYDRAAYEALKNQLQNNIFNIYYDANQQAVGSTVETSVNTGEFNSIGAVYHNWSQFLYNESKDVKKGNNSLTPPSDPRDLPTTPTPTSGPDYILNPDTPKDQYGMLINSTLLDAPFGQFNYDYSSCASSSNADQYGDCVGDIIQANFMNSANNIIGAFSPITPLNTYYKKETNGTFTEKWINNSFREQYSAATTFRDEESMTPFFTDDDPDEQDIEIQGNINTQMYAIEKKQKSKAKTTNFGLGIPVVSHSVSELRGYGNINTQDFFDVNGDGYPDMLYRTQMQLTNQLGGHQGAAGRNIENNGDSVISNNDSFQKANTIAFSPAAIKTVGRNTSNTNSDAKTDTSASWSGGLSYTDYPDSYDKGLKYWIDINGDGLVDRVEIIGDTYKYKLNYGTGLVNSPYEDYKNITTNISKPIGAVSVSIGGGLSDTIDDPSTFSSGWGVSGSLSASASSGSTKQTFQDINGDGLVDIIYVADGGGTSVAYNMGNKFAAPQGISKQGGALDFSNEVKNYNGGLSLNGAFYLNIPLITLWGVTILYFRAGADMTANIGLSVSEINKGLRDVNGDGYPDLVVSSGNGITVNYSKIGRTNKLAKVIEENTKGTFSIDYEFSKPTYNDPHARLVMKEVKIFNPNANSDTYTFSTADKDMITRFKYENSRYDRRERTPYGFEKVITEEIKDGNVYRKNIQTFYNNTYFNNGLPRQNELYTVGGTTLKSRTLNSYKLYRYINGNSQIEEIPSQFETYDAGGTEGKRKTVVLPIGTTNTVFETGGSIVTSTQLTYNGKAQLINYKHISNVPLGNYSSAIAYHDNASLQAKNILNIPSEIKVFDNNNALKRQRNTLVDSNTGDITNVMVKLNNYDTAVTTLTYDAYGNIKTVTYPEGYSLTYDYDIMGKYVTKVTDNFGVYSSSVYDPKWDTILESIDVTGNKIKYTYDGMGRLASILAPKEVGSSPYTVKYTYFRSPLTVNNTQVELYGAITENYDPEHPANPIETITLSDYTGRAVQVKKDIEKDGVEKMSVSGMVMYDVLGRQTKQYHPTFENKDAVLNKKLKLTLSSYFTQTLYDDLDRVVKSIDEDINSTDIEYAIEGSSFKKTVTQLQNPSTPMKTEILSNVEGKTVSVKNHIGGQILTTDYFYNSIGELMDFIDPEGIKTAYNYDLGGRRISEEHPDHGLSQFEYDLAGRITKRYTSNLTNDPSIAEPYILYSYELNRLKSIEYPTLPDGSQNPSNIYYEYGTSGNETAKIVFKQDGTGTTEYMYGNMGEVIKESRVVQGYNIPTMTFNTHYDYDSWNRLKHIKYPDTETVFYEYDLGGNLKKVNSDYFGEYVKDILYDEYEQRTKIMYGNNVYSTFAYYPTKRMLSTHNLNRDNYTAFLSNNYTYDNVGNILSINNTAPITPTSIGGTYQYIYGYDELNRLIHSEGGMETEIKGEHNPTTPPVNTGNMSASYSLDLTYRKAGGIEMKVQNHVIDNNINPLNTYENQYEYIDYSHKVLRVANVATGAQDDFEYDYNGNVTLHNSYLDGPKQIFWDEEDNLKAYYNLEPQSFQYYVYDNKGERAIKYNMNGGADLYQNGALVNGNMTLNSYKVYPNPYVVVSSDNTITKHYYAGSQRIASRLDDNPGTFTKMAPSTAKDAVPERETVDPSVDFKTYLEKIGKDGSTIETVFSKASAVQNGLYYLHGDHLGTATFVTDEGGEATQFFLNLPFGETFAEQQITGKYQNQYKFNAKELDSETGLYYYGARYFNPRLSIWYAVDPIAIWNPVMESEFYGSGQHNDGVFYWGNLNPYIYTYQNPIVYIDPNGKQSRGSHSEFWNGFNENLFSLDRSLTLDTGRWHSSGPKKSGKTYSQLADEADFKRKINASQAYKNGENAADVMLFLGSLITPGPLDEIAAGTRIASRLLKFKPCGCFTASTQVLTENGYKNIEDIKTGDIVWAYDDKTKNIELKKVTQTYSLEFSQIFKISIENEILEVTYEHPFFVGGHWVKVKDLKVGDYLTLYDGTRKKINKIEFIPVGKFKVYNFEVEDFHSYFVGQNKILVHNGGPCNWKSVKLFGHTFSVHGAGKKIFKSLVGRAETGRSPAQGQWLDNQKAADFLMQDDIYSKMVNLKSGDAMDFTLPTGLGQVIEKINGEIVTSPATKVTVVRGDSNFIKVAIPKK